MPSKPEQRKAVKERLTSLSKKQKDEYSRIICDSLNHFIQDDKVLSYYPSKNEANVSEFNLRKDTAYPVTYNEHDMEFYIPHIDLFNENRYGINEPDVNSSSKADYKDYRYIIVPVLGFDEKCHRLGHGKGYYDYYLHDKNLIRVGVAFEIQKLDEITTYDNDVIMDYIVTEKCIYKR